MAKIQYYPHHRDIDHYGCAIDPLEKPYIGKVMEVEVILENNHHAHVRARNGYQFSISKWPLKYWGSARGLFNKRVDAENCLNSPLAIFDSDGILMNKLSKSSQ